MMILPADPDPDPGPGPKQILILGTLIKILSNSPK